RHPELTQHVLSGRAAVELWSGRPEEAVRILEAGLAAEAAAGREYERADWAGPLALAEALAGRLSRAAELAGQALPGGIRPPPGGPDLRLKRPPPSRTPGRSPATARTHRAHSPRRSPMAPCRTGSGCKRCSSTPGSATPAVTLRAVAAPWPPRCGWPNANSS